MQPCRHACMVPGDASASLRQRSSSSAGARPPLLAPPHTHTHTRRQQRAASTRAPASSRTCRSPRSCSRCGRQHPPRSAWHRPLPPVLIGGACMHALAGPVRGDEVREALAHPGHHAAHDSDAAVPGPHCPGAACGTARPARAATAAGRQRDGVLGTQRDQALRLFGRSCVVAAHRRRSRLARPGAHDGIEVAGWRGRWSCCLRACERRRTTARARPRASCCPC